MSDRLKQILSGEGDFTSIEIQEEIDALSAAKMEAEEKLNTIENEIEVAKIENLDKPATKEIKTMESERLSLEDRIPTIGAALVKLERIHTGTVNLENDSELKEIGEKIAALREQKETLAPDALKNFGEAAAQVTQVFGEIGIVFNLPALFNRLSDEQRACFSGAFKAAREGKISLPAEIDALQNRQRELRMAIDKLGG